MDFDIMTEAFLVVGLRNYVSKKWNMPYMI